MITSDRRPARTRNTTIIVALGPINGVATTFGANLRVACSPSRRLTGLITGRRNGVKSSTHKAGESSSRQCKKADWRQSVKAALRPAGGMDNLQGKTRIERGLPIPAKGNEVGF